MEMCQSGECGYDCAIRGAERQSLQRDKTRSMCEEDVNHVIIVLVLEIWYVDERFQGGRDAW